ncbi:MAG: AAA family ATPase [Candidatus Competibacter sp.]|nr:AAA family ATPase [Candidatus Competibacter sp.]MDG4584869.1 AAA family ATPase [Candidatus Competibacter sp.]
MYAAHFGLREPPFAITPDPGYVYPSRHHQEALAHLLYGTSEDGGFVQLTGEVGTGKTTLVRALLEQRLDGVDIALCLNPRLTVEELLATVCDELGVSYPRERQTLKPLLDALNEHLLRGHAAGRRTVLIIDEAQNLSREVLEQIRLLTNLETAKHKLLRIILVGQPELRRLLARPDLRQLAQRITARYHLSPLDPRETAAYIDHRLRVAGGRAELFAAGTRRAVHRYSGGIPRLINVICDRALLGAYSQGARRATAGTVRRAAREALWGDSGKSWVSALRSGSRRAEPADPAVPRAAASGGGKWRVRPWLVLGSGLTGLGMIGLGFWLSHAGQMSAADPTSPPMANPAPSPSPAAMPAGPTPSSAATDALALASLLRQFQGDDANDRLLAAWGITRMPGAGALFCEWVKIRDLRCLTGRDDWNMLRRFNRPAVLRLTVGDRPAAVLLRTLEGDNATLEIAGQAMTVPLAQLAPLWTGQYLLLWRPQINSPLIGPGNTGKAVRWLRRRLALAADQPSPEPSSATFDGALGERLRAFQQDNGLQPDGLAGERTLVLLNNLAPTPGTPTLDPSAHQDR